MHTRRKFLQSLAGAGIAAATGGSLATGGHPQAFDNATIGEPFGLAPIKAESTAIAFDQLDVRPGGIMTKADFSKVLADSLNEAFREVYEDWPDDIERLR